ncbi:hypothetical protein GGX14DRAFT_391701 [Mycena pura]|uniref:Uncharacterized protein n=1 Tax=Mycena pura TaxID=153505 RepID=A0AAD6VKZ3_9AGAR|nr:hypothetical protein GGX14DRAFT_391701 [Mycena pura]
MPGLQGERQKEKKLALFAGCSGTTARPAPCAAPDSARHQTATRLREHITISQASSYVNLGLYLAGGFSASCQLFIHLRAAPRPTNFNHPNFGTRRRTADTQAPGNVLLKPDYSLAASLCDMRPVCMRFPCQLARSEPPIQNPSASGAFRVLCHSCAVHGCSPSSATQFPRYDYPGSVMPAVCQWTRPYHYATAQSHPTRALRRSFTSRRPTTPEDLGSGDEVVKDVYIQVDREKWVLANSALDEKVLRQAKFVAKARIEKGTFGVIDASVLRKGESASDLFPLQSLVFCDSPKITFGHFTSCHRAGLERDRVGPRSRLLMVRSWLLHGSIKAAHLKQMMVSFLPHLPPSAVRSKPRSDDAAQCRT